MASSIIETDPQTGIDQPVSVIRNNFIRAKLDIEELQTLKVDRKGDIMLGVIQLHQVTTAALPNATLNTAGLLFDIDTSSVLFSDGADWITIGSATGLAGISFPGNANKVIRINASETAFEVFTLPSTIALPPLGGNSLEIVRVNAGETAYETTLLTDSAFKLPPLVGNSLQFVRVNAGVTAFETVIIPDSVLTMPSTAGNQLEVVRVNAAGTAFETVPDFTGFDVAFFVGGFPTSLQVSGQFVAVRDISFPINLTGSLAVAGVAATASTDFDIQKNGGSIGTMNFAISATTATFTFSSIVSFVAGDILKVVAPVAPDATLFDISMTFKGDRL